MVWTRTSSSVGLAQAGKREHTGDKEKGKETVSPWEM